MEGGGLIGDRLIEVRLYCKLTETSPKRRVNIVLHYIVLYCTSLYCAVYHRIALYCIILGERTRLFKGVHPGYV